MILFEFKNYDFKGKSFNLLLFSFSLFIVYFHFIDSLTSCQNLFNYTR